MKENTAMTAPIATVLVIIFAVVGGIVVLTQPGTLSFKEYLESITVAVAGLAVGRGLAARKVD